MRPTRQAVLLCCDVVAPAAVVLVCAQLPEPNCNSNRYEGNEVWSAVVNSIGQGAGEFW